MKNGVKAREVRRKAEEIGLIADFSDNGVRSEATMIEFKGWTSGTNVTAK